MSQLKNAPNIVVVGSTAIVALFRGLTAFMAAIAVIAALAAFAAAGFGDLVLIIIVFIRGILEL